MMFSIILIVGTAQTAFAGENGFPCTPEFGCIEFDTELLSLDLVGGPYLMPLASDPGNSLGDSIEGFGLVNSDVRITLSSQRSVNPGPPSLGQASALPDTSSPGPNPETGDPFIVDSFFDVFFDITVTDVDTRSGRDYPGQPDGASITLPDNGPASLITFYQAIFDQNAPNFGLIPPPQVNPYIGHFQIEIPLGGDINANGEDDKIKFTLASHAAGDDNRIFTVLPDGTTIDEFDSAAFLEGVVVDLSTDPPFTLGAGSVNLPAFSGPGSLIGPTVATSTCVPGLVCPVSVSIGGQMINVDSTTLILAGSQMTAAWILPVIVAGAGFAIVIARKF